jgi:hypothetical protein
MLFAQAEPGFFHDGFLCFSVTFHCPTGVG